MPAIITDTLRSQIARDFFDQFENNEAIYYVAIGKSDQWDSNDIVPTPSNNPSEIKNLKDAMQSIKKIQAVSQVVPRNNWSSGTIYSQYDDLQAGYPSPPYYVRTENAGVYICLETGRNANGVAVPSTVEPTSVNEKSFRTADGYVWKFLYTISAINRSNFQSSNFMPVQKQGDIDSNSTGIQLKQKSVQDAAIAGQILNIVITNAGTGYNSNPTVRITDALGDSAEAIAIIDSATGTLARIRMTDSASTIKHGSGYTSPVISFIGGTPTDSATARAVVSSNPGIGSDARVDLKSTGIMFHADIIGNDSNFIVDQDFRQVALYKDPKDRLGAAFTANTGNALKKMTLSSVVTSFTKDKIIVGQDTEAKAYIDNIDSNEIYYHQTSTTGFKLFNDNEVITELNGAGEGVTDSSRILPEVDTATGSILYIDNRAPVLRSNSQDEDIKIIIQF